MMKKAIFLVIGVLLLGINLPAEAGDLIVEGNVGVGTTNPADKVVIQLNGDMGWGINTVSGLAIKSPDSQHSPALTFTGGGPNGGGTGKIVYDSGNGRFNFWGGGFGVPAGQQIIWDGVSEPNNISVPTRGNAIFHFRTSINLETESDNTGKIIIPYGKVGIGTANPTAILQVAGGDAYTSTAGNGLIVKSPNGAICKRIGIDNNGAIVPTSVTCP